MGVLQMLSKSKEERHLKKYLKTVDKINGLEKEFEQLSDDELRMKTVEFKQLIADGSSVDDLKVEAFAVVREASKRVLGLRHFDVQIIGGLVLLEGNISEMPTGEGKTLVASLPSYLRALEGKGVHVITVNEYLARRDRALIGQIHEFLGLTVGLNVPGLHPLQKQEAYEAEITYGIGTEFGFDFLRDNMAYAKSQKVQRKYYYAIIDEVDSVLIDEAKTPLIIAGKTMPSENLANVCAKVTKNFQQDAEFHFDHELKTVNLTDEGINKIERAFGIENLFDLEHRSLYHYMLQALRARVLFTRDVDYIVDQGEVKLVDMNTGRIMEGRSLSDGLHQAIEAKEGLKVTEENKAQASVSIQNYFRMYPVLSGMTGTAKTEKTEFQHVYGMDVIQIPTNKSVIRKDLPDLVFKTKEQKYRRMVEEVRQRHEKGQPILIGTTSILQSEVVAEYLDEAGLSYQLLNAKSVEHEAHLISLAGQMSQITIATNMAGRGTDIMLGEGVAELGGLHVLGTEKHESRRIDNQLKGRSGRQGDPGSTQFIISLEDELFIRFAKEDVETKLPTLTTDSTGLILDKDIHKFVDKVQKISEGSHFSVREFSLKLDDIINDQREVIYKLRDQIFYSTNMIEILKKHVEPVVLDLVDKHCPEESIPEEWDLKSLQTTLDDIMLVEVIFDGDYEKPEDVFEAVKPFLAKHLEDVSFHENVEEIHDALRQIGLALLDHHWTEHLDEMNRMKEGVGIRHYQQEDPIRTYQKEGFELFEIMYYRLELDLSRRLTRTIQQFEARKIKIDLT